MLSLGQFMNIILRYLLPTLGKLLNDIQLFTNSLCLWMSDFLFYVLLQALGTKNKKNRSFHGFGTLQFGNLNDYNSAKLFGLKNKKCLKSSIKELISISGYFENDILKV